LATTAAPLRLPRGNRCNPAGSTEARAGQEEAAAAAVVRKTGTGDLAALAALAALADQEVLAVDPGRAAAQPDRDVTGLGKSGPKRFEFYRPGPDAIGAGSCFS